MGYYFRRNFGGVNLRLLLISMILPCIFGLYTGWNYRYQITYIVDVTRSAPYRLSTYTIVMTWIVLYLLFGLATSLVLPSRSYGNDKRNALVSGILQLVLHTLFVHVFFGLRLFLLGFLIQIGFVIMAGICCGLYYQLNRLAGVLMGGYVGFGVYMTWLVGWVVFCF